MVLIVHPELRKLIRDLPLALRLAPLERPNSPVCDKTVLHLQYWSLARLQQVEGAQPGPTLGTKAQATWICFAFWPPAAFL